MIDGPQFRLGCPILESECSDEGCRFRSGGHEYWLTHIQSPRVFGEEPKLLNNLVEYFESFCYEFKCSNNISFVKSLPPQSRRYGRGRHDGRVVKLHKWTSEQFRLISSNICLHSPTPSFKGGRLMNLKDHWLNQDSGKTPGWDSAK